MVLQQEILPNLLQSLKAAWQLCPETSPRISGVLFGHISSSKSWMYCSVMFSPLGHMNYSTVQITL